MNSLVTVVITSCNRLELLKRTIESFRKMNDYPIEEFIVIEDSANVLMHQWLSELYPNITFIFNGKNEGLINSIDRAYAIVKTPFVFHSEDDWEYTKPGFIRASLNIMENNHMVQQVWLENMHNQPLDPETISAGGTPYKYAAYDGMDHIWHGFSFHPGIKSMRIYKELAPYSQWSPESDFLALRECKIGEEYMRKNYRAAVLFGEYCIHTGGGQSTWIEKQ